MKTLKALLVIFLLITCFIMQGQTVKTTKVLGHTFSVGDTIILTKGTMPNGDFMSTFVASTLSPMEKPTHLSMENTNFKFLIEEIELHKTGMNTSTLLTIHYRDNTIAWVDASVAITKKEIVLK
jgi:hypothetical protein